jgi:hypothetical protein
MAGEVADRLLASVALVVATAPVGIAIILAVMAALGAQISSRSVMLWTYVVFRLVPALIVYCALFIVLPVWVLVQLSQIALRDPAAFPWWDFAGGLVPMIGLCIAPPALFVCVPVVERVAGKGRPLAQILILGLVAMYIAFASWMFGMMAGVVDNPWTSFM